MSQSIIIPQSIKTVLELEKLLKGYKLISSNINRAIVPISFMTDMNRKEHRKALFNYFHINIGQYIESIKTIDFKEAYLNETGLNSKDIEKTGFAITFSNNNKGYFKFDNLRGNIDKSNYRVEELPYDIELLCEVGIQRYAMKFKQEKLLEKEQHLVRLESVADVHNGASLPGGASQSKIFRGVNASFLFSDSIAVIDDKTVLPELKFSRLRPILLDGVILISGFCYSLQQMGRAIIATKATGTYCVCNNIQVVRLKEAYRDKNSGYLKSLYEWLSKHETFSSQIVAFDTNYVNLTTREIENLMVPGPGALN